MMNEAIFKIITEDVAHQLEQAQTDEEFRRILTENGATEEEISQFVEYLLSISAEGEAELSPEDLDAVAGGGNPILQKAFLKMVYRVTHGKIFVKATYDEDARTITVTNRFGKKDPEEYIY